jgi:hypothetical protein
MRQFLTLVAILFVVGCGTDRAKQDLERQNLLAEIANRNDERSAELSKREQAVASKEHDNQDTLDKLNRLEAELSERERHVGQLAEKAAKLQANAEATMQSVKDRESRLQEMVTKIDTARELARMRQPFLEELATNAAKVLAEWGANPPGTVSFKESLSGSFPGRSLPDRFQSWLQPRKEYYRVECLQQLANSNVVLIVSDAEFKAKATEVVDRFVRFKAIPWVEELLRGRSGTPYSEVEAASDRRPVDPQTMRPY